MIDQAYPPQEIIDSKAVLARLQDHLVDILHLRSRAGRWRPFTFVILMVGVNGAGKTTTIGKLARAGRR